MVLGAGEELFARRLRARGLNLIDRESLEEPLEVTAKIRYGQREQPAIAVQTGPDTLEVVFREPQRGHYQRTGGGSLPGGHGGGGRHHLLKGGEAMDWNQARSSW